MRKNLKPEKPIIIKHYSNIGEKIKPCNFDVEIKNKDILKSLDNYLHFYYNKERYFSTGWKLQGHDFINNRELWISDEHRDKIVNQGTKHCGFPEGENIL